ncbi:unnamed protein product, partial [Symbiodinium microadriaticum]
AIATIAWLGRRRSKAGKNAVAEEVNLRELPEAEVPKRLRPEFYFDFQAYPFAHSKLLQEAHDVIQVLELLPKYLKEQLQLEKESLVSCTRGSVSCPCVPATASPTVLLEDPCTVIVEPDKMLLDPATAAQEALSALLLRKGAQILGGIIDLRKGPVALGPGAVVEPGAFVAGPAMIGAGTVVRSGAYIRGDVLVGEKAVLRGELKNSLVMDKAELAHPGYAGDSLIGYKGHFGCQALTANLGLFGNQLSVSLPGEEASHARPVRVRLGRRKVGAILGDFAQLGCSSVTDPATFLAPRTVTYTLCRLSSGFYGPDEIIKNKPEEAGALQRIRLLPK